MFMPGSPGIVERLAPHQARCGARAAALTLPPALARADRCRLRCTPGNAARSPCRAGAPSRCQVYVSHLIPLLNEHKRLGEKTGKGFYKVGRRGGGEGVD